MMAISGFLMQTLLCLGILIVCLAPTEGRTCSHRQSYTTYGTEYYRKKCGALNLKRCRHSRQTSTVHRRAVYSCCAGFSGSGCVPKPPLGVSISLNPSNSLAVTTTKHGSHDSAVKYKVQLYENDDPQTTKTVPSNGKNTFSGLSPGRTFHVTGWSLEGSALSTTVTSNSIDTDPEPPSSIMVSLNGHSLVVTTSTATSHDSSHSSRVCLYKNDNPGTTQGVSGNGLNTYTDLTPGRKYQAYAWTVRGSSTSQTISSNIVYTDPAPPAQIYVSIDVNILKVMTTKAASHDNSHQSKVRLFVNDIPGATQDVTSNGQNTFSGLTAGQKYQVYGWTVKGSLTSTTISSNVVYTVKTSVVHNVTFGPHSVFTIDLTAIEDNDTTTCTTLQSGQQRAYKSRLDLSLRSGNTSIDVMGKDLRCSPGEGLYLVALTPAQTTAWYGRWNTCSLAKEIHQTNDVCRFSCFCEQMCPQIQLDHRPQPGDTTGLTLCDFAHTRRDCQDVRQIGHFVDDVYYINVNGQITRVFCNLTTDEEGWTVLMSRRNGSVDFNRNWADYRNGFGDLSWEFWFGNENMHHLTSDGRNYILRVEGVSFDGDVYEAEFDHFTIADETDKYRLDFGSFLSGTDNPLQYHKDMMFSTLDQDNDLNVGNCAALHSGGWWYNSCKEMKLTGLYGPSHNDKGILWTPGKVLKYVDMKIRPAK